MLKIDFSHWVSSVSACNVAMTILGSKYERMKYSFSRASYFDKYSSKRAVNWDHFGADGDCDLLGLLFCPIGPWMMGAAMSAFYINEAATILPKAVMTKMRTYLAGTYADVLEV